MHNIPTCRERAAYEDRLEYERRRADIAEQRRERDRRDRAERRRDITAYALLIAVIAISIWFAGAGLHEFILWANGR